MKMQDASLGSTATEESPILIIWGPSGTAVSTRRSFPGTNPIITNFLTTAESSETTWDILPRLPDVILTMGVTFTMPSEAALQGLEHPWQSSSTRGPIM